MGRGYVKREPTVEEQTNDFYLGVWWTRGGRRSRRVTRRRTPEVLETGRQHRVQWERRQQWSLNGRDMGDQEVSSKEY